MMKALIVYDSAFGNTAKIAHEIGNAIGAQVEVAVCQVSNVLPEQMTNLDLLIVGSPTQRFRPTAAITSFLKGGAVQGLKGVKVAAFDTRLAASDINSSALRFMLEIGGYAAKHIAKRLKQKGGELVMPPEGFCVEEKEGPLKVGELERAAAWAKQVAAAQAIAA